MERSDKAAEWGERLVGIGRELQQLGEEILEASQAQETEMDSGTYETIKRAAVEELSKGRSHNKRSLASVLGVSAPLAGRIIKDLEGAGRLVRGPGVVDTSQGVKRLKNTIRMRGVRAA